ncbi:MAG: hypothetical protein H6Q67_1868 [Firmicutes bacterium]|nr:hypothetical protein [Bacillota bacterium]
MGLKKSIITVEIEHDESIATDKRIATYLKNATWFKGLHKISVHIKDAEPQKDLEKQEEFENICNAMNFSLINFFKTSPEKQVNDPSPSLASLSDEDREIILFKKFLNILAQPPRIRDAILTLIEAFYEKQTTGKLASFETDENKPLPRIHHKS